MMHTSRFILFIVLLFSLTEGKALHFERNQEENTKPATIKVLLEKGIDGALLEIKGKYKVYNPYNGKRVSGGIKGKRYYIYPHEEGIKWGEDFLGIFQLQIVPNSPETTILVNGIQYRGAIELYHINGKLNVINEVDVETYLKSIMTHRIKKNIHQSVLDAIAIVERTNAYYTALVHSDSYWHVDGKEVGYDGFGLTLQTLEVDRAVDNTKYLVMTYESQPFPTDWHEHSAGKTASFSDVYRKNVPTPNGILTPFAEKVRDEFKWQKKISSETIANIIKTNRVTGMELFLDPTSSKVYAIRIHDGSHYEDIDFFTLQKKLGKEQLPSNDFHVNIKGKEIIFTGYGVGSGVGLCVYSAIELAKKGDQTPNILGEFFPLSRLERMRSFPTTVVSMEKNSFINPRKWKKR